MGPVRTGIFPVDRAPVVPQVVACARPGVSRDLGTALSLRGRHQMTKP